MIDNLRGSIRYYTFLDTEKSFEVKDDKILFHEDFKRPEALYLNELKRANALVIGINKILQSYFAATESKYFKFSSSKLVFFMHAQNFFAFTYLQIIHPTKRL